MPKFVTPVCAAVDYIFGADATVGTRQKVTWQHLTKFNLVNRPEQRLDRGVVKGNK